MEYRTLSTVFRPAGKGDRALRFGVKKKTAEKYKKSVDRNERLC